MAANLNLTEGSDYGYAELMASLEGGSHQFYLPFRGQQVFAAFLNRSKNPQAPTIILVGNKPKVAQAGARLAAQPTPIPVFVKQSTNIWRYQGLYRSLSIVDRHATNLMAIQAKREDVVFALSMQKVIDATGDDLPTFQEGKCGQVTRNVYERSYEARELCLQHYGRRCYVCDLLFAEEYGDRGDGFIHVHHLKPLNASEGKVFTDPIKDLRPVCANCHAMIHNGGKLISPERLREAYWAEESQVARQARIAKH